jgi:hypothetical protein
MSQATISRVEGGTPGIKAETYDKILRALGLTKITIHFSEQNDVNCSPPKLTLRGRSLQV